MKRTNGIIIWVLAVLAILFLAGITSAVPSEQWNRTFGGISDDGASSVQQTPDGGYILAGTTNSYGIGGDAWLIKTDANGNQQWYRTFGGSSSDSAVSFWQTSDGGYILVGGTSSYGAGSADVWLIKTDVNGNQQWNKTFGGSYSDGSSYVQQTSDGGYILAGTTNSYGVGSADAWLIKTDVNGDQQWNKTFGGTAYDYAGFAQQTSDGGYIVGITTESYGGGSPGHGVPWLIKTDASGNQQWNNTFGETWAEFSSVQQTLDGGYALAGYTFSSGVAGHSDAFLTKTYANGTQQWKKLYGGVNRDGATSVQQTPDGGYILAGHTDLYGADVADAWLIKTDTNGNMQWSLTFGGASGDIAHSVMQTSDGGYILAGGTSSYSAGSFDAWLIKFVEEATSNSIGYSALVATGQSTSIQSSNGTFGLLLKGQSKTLNNSVILNNTGDISARIEARFNDSIGGVFGLVSGANVLNATNFALGIPGALALLNNSGADVQVAVAPPGVTALNARLGVPNEQAAGDYSGTVVLTFSNSV